MTDEQLSALLRIKRFEQPPPQYFDRLLQDVHRRQRSELLRRPLWKIAAERVQTLFSEHSMGNLSYAGALASVLLVGVVSIGYMTQGRPGSGGAVAVERATGSELRVADATSPSRNEQSRLVTLQTSESQPVLGVPNLPTINRVGYEPAVGQPRYIIDTRPQSYEKQPIVKF